MTNEAFLSQKPEARNHAPFTSPTRRVTGGIGGSSYLASNHRDVALNNWRMRQINVIGMAAIAIGNPSTPMVNVK